jgi:hypothetical protein
VLSSTSMEFGSVRCQGVPRPDSADARVSQRREVPRSAEPCPGGVQNDETMIANANRIAATDMHVKARIAHMRQHGLGFGGIEFRTFGVSVLVRSKNPP